MANTNTKIPLFSAEAVNAGLDLSGAIGRVLDSHWYVLGTEVAAFEHAFAAWSGSKNCVTLGNGTDALELALRGLGVSTGDRVILAANAGFYGSTAVRLIGAEPVYADVDPRLLTLSVDSLDAALAKRPKAVIVTHLYGQLADIEAIVERAAAVGVPVIEDCAQAHGAERGGRRAGSFGAVGCFSFYPTKNLGALGDGGALVSDDDELIARVRKLRQYGWGSKYSVDVAGGRNSRLDEMQAAILLDKLPHLDRWNGQRRSIATRYNLAFSDLPFTCPASVGEDYVGHLYVIRSAARDAFRASLAEDGVATDVHYPIPDHLQRAYACAQVRGSLPVTERVCDEVVSLPCFPGMEDLAVQRVIEACRRACATVGA
jgi:dTDP-4-amino-4,6-dideoxygalactose transaminase